MLQQLAHETGAQPWVIGSMLLFVTVFALVVIRVFRTPSAEHRAHAALPLDDVAEDGDEVSSSAP
jgi:hypothetical protein